MKKSLPIWSVVAAIGAATVMVIFVFTKAAGTDPNHEELMKIRGNMQSWSGGPPPQLNASAAPK